MEPFDLDCRAERNLESPPPVNTVHALNNLCINFSSSELHEGIYTEKSSKQQKTRMCLIKVRVPVSSARGRHWGQQ